MSAFNPARFLRTTACLAVFLLATTASAATLDITDRVLTYTAGAGVTNNLTLTFTGVDYTITDTEPITLIGEAASEGWTNPTANSATGPGSGSEAAVISIIINLGDMNDTASINTSDPTVVNGEAGNDTFNVTPSGTSPSSSAITIAGGAPIPPALPGDTLNVNQTGTTGLLLASASGPNGFSGSYTFTNRGAVNFSEIESLGPTAAIPTISELVAMMLGLVLAITGVIALGQRA